MAFFGEMDGGDPPENTSTYVWEIENFSMCPQSKEECLKSNTFYVDSMDVSEFQLILYPREWWYSKDETPICLLECRQQSDFHLNVTMDIAYGNEHVEKKKENVLLNTSETIAFPIDLCKRTDQTDFSLLPSDLLTLRCTITPICRGPQALDVDLKTLSEDLGRLYRMGLFSDFCLIAKGRREFLVHKVMLMVRCRELASKVGIFDEECKEVLMDKVSPEAMDVLLHYVYTGRLIEHLPSDLLNEIYVLADDFEMDDLRRDLFPVDICTVGRTIVKVDHHEITWDLVDFHERVVKGDWPTQTFLDLVVGRFILSFSICTDGKGDAFPQVDLQCLGLNLDRALTMKCEVKVFTLDSESGETLCKGVHRFDTKNLGKLFAMKGDYTALYKSVKSLPDSVALVLNFKVSHPCCFEKCTKTEVINSLYTPHPFWRRSLHRLSYDMDLIFKHTLEEDGGIDDSDSLMCTDLRVQCSFGPSVPCHRFVLCARSPVLMGEVIGNVFSGRTAEIGMYGTGPDTVQNVLRYVYCGKLSGDLDTVSIMSVYMLAEKYQLSTLAKRCLLLFRLKMGMRDLMMLLVASADLKDEQLLKAVASFIRPRKERVLDSHEWAQILKEVPLCAGEALTLADSQMDLNPYSD